MTPSTARLVALTIRGPAGDLEALLQTREPPAPAVAALVCHPHPLYGGTLHNKVVHRVASVLVDSGAAVMRFNFRGVGKSAGTHDAGVGEVEDAKAALDEVRRRFPVARVWIAGFSFGSWIAARLAVREPGVGRLILVAPPVGTSSFEVLHTSTIPKLVIQGNRDVNCPVGLLEREFPRWADPKELRVVEGATHFFDKQLSALADALVQGLASLEEGATS